MSKGQFVSLHNHTEQGSPLDGFSDIGELFDRAKEIGHESIVISDHGTCTAHYDSFKASNRSGVKLIPGEEIYFATDLSDKKSSHMVLLPKTAEGYKNILRLNYEAYNNQKSGYMGKMTPRISWEHIEKYNHDVFCLTACSNGLLSKDIVSDNFGVAEANIKRLHSIFNDRLYLEIQPHSLKTDDGKVDQVKLNEKLIEYSEKYRIQYVTTCDAHYVTKEDSKFHDMMLSVKEKKPLSDPNRFRYGVQEMYLKSSDEIVDFFGSDIANIAMKNSIIIADACEVPNYLKSRGAILPKFPVNKQADYEVFKEWWVEKCEELPEDKAYLRYKCVLGFQKFTEGFSDEKKIEYWNRVKYELSVLELHNFSSYMLIVSDYVGWANNNEVICGPARGSCAGSLVAFLTEITKVDPIRYNLLFERFHNKQKKSFPDIDCDFSDPGRVKAYIRDKYGKDYVAQISNWAVMTPKVVLKDIARSLEIGGGKSEAFEIANHITSIMPDCHSIAEAIEISDTTKEREFSRFMTQYPEIKEYSEKLQNLTRQWSIHAAGVVISDTILSELVPLRIGDEEEDEDGGTIAGEAVTATQWEKTRVEEFGLVKMDILGLKTLTIISNAIKYIKESVGVDLKIDDIPLDDIETYKMISRGDNLGVFQLESSLSPLCMKIKPKDVETVAAINALGRPSCPAEQRKAYIDRRSGKEEVSYTHSSLERALKPTYGVSLYEESMMTIAADCAGWDLNEADGLRKYTKLKGKDPALALKIETDFLKGCMEHSKMTYEKAEDVWEREIKSFSGYGFNKSLAFNLDISVIPPNCSNWHKIKICDVEPGSIVKSRDEITGKDIDIKIIANHCHGILKVFKVILDSNSVVVCTINHKFRTTDGQMVPLYKILEDNLKIVEADIAPHRSVHYTSGSGAIVSCEMIGEYNTHDLEVDHPDHQYYLANGILTSNSHAISYSIISVQTAWLKQNYPTQYMCALLNGQDPNSDKAQSYIVECKRLGIKITPPDINKGAENYKVISDKVISTGFSAVKGLGPKAIPELIKNQPYSNLCEFLLKGNDITLKDEVFGDEIMSATEWLKRGIPLPKDAKQGSEGFIGKGALQSLAACGALDIFGRKRKDIYENYESYRTKVKTAIKKGKVPTDIGLGLPETNDEWERKELLYNEREIMGRPLSGETHEIFKGFFKGGSETLKFSMIKSLKTGSMIKVEGIVKTMMKEFKIKKGPKTGRKFAKYMIEDLEGNTTGLTMWTDHYEKFGSQFKDGTPFKAICKVGEYMDEKSLNLEEVLEIFGIKRL